MTSSKVFISYCWMVLSTLSYHCKPHLIQMKKNSLRFWRKKSISFISCSVLLIFLTLLSVWLLISVCVLPVLLPVDEERVSNFELVYVGNIQQAWSFESRIDDVFFDSAIPVSLSIIVLYHCDVDCCWLSVDCSSGVVIYNIL